MKVYRHIIGLLLLAFPLAAAAQPDSALPVREVRVRLVDAVRQYEAGHYRAARNRLGALVKASPDNDALWYYLGLCETARGDYDAAAGAFRRAADLAPGNYWYKDRLSSIYAYQGADSLTIALYEDLLAEYPRKVDISFRLLNLYVRHGRYDKALATLTDIEGLIGKSERTTSTRYDLYRELGRPDEAIRVLEDYNAEYASPSILSMAGDYYLADFQDSLALARYDEAVALESDCIPAILGRSEVFRTTRRYDEYFDVIGGFIDNPAISGQSKGLYLSTVIRQVDPGFIRTYSTRFDALVDSSVVRHPADSMVLSTAGMYYYATGRMENASALFRANAGQHPESLGAEAAYVQVLAYTEAWDSLKTASREAFARFPEETAFLEYESMADYNLGDYAAVIGTSRRILALHPADSARRLSAYATMGDMYHLTGDEKSAYAAYEAALKINPSYAPVLNNYAYYLSLTGKKLGKARQMSRRTVEAEPDNPTYLDTYGWILYLQKRYKEAKPYFKHAMLYGGKDNVTILDHYAEVLYALQEYDLAQVYWTQALSKNDGTVPDLEDRVAARLASIGR